METKNNPGFDDWFDAAYPEAESGSRPSYQLAGVMDLMRASWQAGQAALAESIGAGGVSALVPAPFDAQAAEIAALKDILADFAKMDFGAAVRTAEDEREMDAIARRARAAIAQAVQHPSLICPTCKVDRLKEGCKGVRSGCQMAGQAQAGQPDCSR